MEPVTSDVLLEFLRRLAIVSVMLAFYLLGGVRYACWVTHE